MSQLLKASGAMAAATMTSRVLGMVREIVYARFMGDSWVAGAFQLAFMIPNLFRRLLGEGALSAAFIPIFKEKEKREGEPQMWHAANAVISALVLSATAIIVLALIGITVALAALALPVETRLMLQLLRVMFPYMLLVCLAAVFIGMLNARGHFFIPAMGATMLNVVMIGSVLFLAPRMGTSLETQIFGLAIGVLIAGVAQAAFQLPTLHREGYRYRWVAPWGDETVKQVARNMIPGTIGVAAYQLNVLLTQGIAFGVDPTIVASFNYAVRLMELPQGVFGISVATYMLPALAGLAAEKKLDEYRGTLTHGLGHLLMVNLIASVLLVALAEPIVRLLFERGRFTPDSTVRVSFALACLAPGLVAFSAVNVLARAFYALGDTRTPMQMSVISLALNLVLTICLIGPFRQGGLGAANTLSACANVALLLTALKKKLGGLGLAPLRRALAPLALAALVAGATAWLSWRGCEAWLGHATIWAKVCAVFVPAGLGTAAYSGLTLALRLPQAIEVRNLLLERLGLGRTRA
ncbi:MAG: murein biosynthesis integral membrane protein MurJ [Verrucomicrobiae bacterium]|nr:murein biosynthesis integral membrane protein MurJ [Verrucomicrobiae bacterium]